MKIYLAGASKQRAFIGRLATLAEAQGHTITHRWWDCFTSRWTLNHTFEDAARADLAGVATCEVFVVVLDDVIHSPGAHLEMGYALALRKPVLAILTDWDKQLRENIWLHLPQVRLAQMDEDLDAKLSGLTYQLQMAQFAAITHATA